MPQTLFDVGIGISLDGTSDIRTGSTDPSLVGLQAPVGSLYLRTNGELWQKFDVSQFAWRLPTQQSLSQNVDGGAASTVFDPLFAIDGGSANG